MTMSDPRQDEATGKDATVKWRDETFTVSREYDDMSVDFIESLEEGKAVGIVRGALGPEQWRVVRAMNLNMRELGELSDLLADAMGFGGGAGESSASGA